MSDLKVFEDFCDLANLNFLLLKKYAARFKPVDSASDSSTSESRLVGDAPLRIGIGVYNPPSISQIVAQLIFDEHVVATLTTYMDVEVAEFTVDWVSVHWPESKYRSSGLIIIEPYGTSEERSEQFLNALRKQRRRRMSRFKTCQYCNRRTPPHYLHGKDCCMSCAEKHYGIVH